MNYWEEQLNIVEKQAFHKMLEANQKRVEYETSKKELIRLLDEINKHKFRLKNQQ